MEFSFTKEEEEFRSEVRGFLEKELTPEFKERLWASGEPDFSLEFSKKLGDRGWIGLTWPKKYGGLEETLIKQAILNEALGEFDAPTDAHKLGAGLLGPILLMYGTEDQKRTHLTGMARGDVVWCEGMSEPEAGSDALALRTTAVRKGDDYVINGQKVWTSCGHLAQWMYVTTRTNPNVSKSRGISYFLLDMKTPGIEVRPLIDMTGWHHFNEVFFADVRVPKENIIGEENQGAEIMTALLNVEHSGVGSAAHLRQSLKRLIQFCKETPRNGKPLTDDPLIRSRLAELIVEAEVGRWMTYRVLWMESKGMHTSLEGPMNKAFSSELYVRLAKAGMDILGLYAPLHRDSRWVVLMGDIQRRSMWTLGQTIAGGTTEIQKYIMATRGLGLPRGPR